MILPKEQRKSIKLMFLDSLRMMPSSLDKLSANLMRSGGVSAFKNTLSEIGEDKFNNLVIWEKEKVKNKKQTIVDENYTVQYNNYDEKSIVKKTKGVFPYEYVDSWEKI